jgi:hypothetical protein
MRTSKLLANRGSDIDFSFTWVDADGDPVDLTGWSISTMDVSSAIASLLTSEITTPSVGLISGRIEWDDALQANVPYLFRIQLTSGIEDRATNLIEVVYQ